MQSADDHVHELVARYVLSKQLTVEEVAARHAIVAELLAITESREEVARLLKMSPQRVSAIVGGVRK